MASSSFSVVDSEPDNSDDTQVAIVWKTMLKLALSAKFLYYYT